MGFICNAHITAMSKFLALAAALPVAMLGLSACETYGDYGYGYGGGGYSYGSGYGGNYGYSQNYYGSPGYYGGSGYYDGGLIYNEPFYDSFYGPIYDGYWGPDNYFYYQLRIGGGYVRDYNRHFRRDYFSGSSRYRVADRRDHDRRDGVPNLWENRDNNRDRNNGGNWNGNDRNGNDRDGRGGSGNNWQGNGPNA